MPFYEYECSNCKFYTEVMQKISDAPLTKCPSCGKSALVKLVSAPNFRLKGGGWYETDFKGDKENKRNLAGGESDDASSSSDSSAKADSDSKAESPKTEASSSDSKPAIPSVSTGGGGSGGRGGSSKPAAKPAAKPASRVPAGKAKVAAKKGKAAPARSKAKPAAKKKGRR
jgi:putative FmdB family regulatory protein